MTSKPKHYPDAQQNPDFPAIEKEVLAFWQREGIFNESVEQRAGANEFIFYDGPPFANGLPHYGHLLTGFVKDVFARYQTMRGKRVERRFGWDCHGLPAEMGSEKELGISGRAAITSYGIDKFNEHCRTSVMKYTAEWEQYVTRQARWVDFKNDYKTMDTNFMESVLWAFKQLYDKGLVYEAYRVMPYSWAAETPLSNFETKLDNSYREREDKAITVAFELNEVPENIRLSYPNVKSCKIYAWTTTPWTLPSNLALAISKKVNYCACIFDNVAIITSSTYAEKNFPDYCNPTITSGIGLQETILLEKERAQKFPKLEFAVNDGLIGLTYKPLFPYFENAENAFQILDGSEFVTDTDGTGIVHIAPAFGEDDFKLSQKYNIGKYKPPLTGLLWQNSTEAEKEAFDNRVFVCPVDGQGKYTNEIFDFSYDANGNIVTAIQQIMPPSYNQMPASDKFNDGWLSLSGLNVIAESGGSKFGLANDLIVAWLKKHGQLIKQEQIKHNYPHCWRTDTPLIYRAMPSWYVEVTKFRDRAVELNKQINWIPDHIRDGQMAHMLATAPDWSISRNRFWGTPIPVWRGDKGGIKVFGSIAELKDFFEVSGDRCKVTDNKKSDSLCLTPDTFDLHRPFIDTLVKTDEHGETWRRVEDVFDCWFESGSMPFAQVHYPFENKEWFETHFPADFITEYVGQTRGWFNTLIMLSTALFDKPPFKNCICHGVVLDAETGLKYSKRLKNYKDPLEVIEVYGADALRWMMISSPVMRGSDLMVDPEGKFIRDVVRLAIKPIWNAYNFFTLYANADGIKAKHATDSQDVMDRYILAKCAGAVEQIKNAMDAYDAPTACETVLQFFEALNNWYIRRSKERFWKEEKDADKQAAYDTLYTVLITMCKAAAPLLPLTLEEIYKGLTGEASVHLASYPECHPGEGRDPRQASAPPMGVDASLRWHDTNELIAQMDWVRDVCNAALAIRNKVNIRVRQPLKSLTIVASGKSKLRGKLLTEDGDISKQFDYLYEIIKNEVNVKTVASGKEFQSFQDAADIKLQINSQVLGKRLPAMMKQILPASKKGEWEDLQGGGIAICGEKLLPGEYTLQLEPKPEYANRAQALSTNDALVILDTTLTPELIAEGIARDVVRMVQQARKDAGLDVSDKIDLSITASANITAAIHAYAAYITEQTLATTLDVSPPRPGWFVAEKEIEGAAIVISLKKAA